MRSMVGALLLSLAITASAFADARVTTYPIVFAHGMAGFDDILGYDYWGDDFGVYVLDGCSLLEINGCNIDIDPSQKSFVASVTPFHNSETRGTELYNDIRGYMASVGATKVNLVGHSQGGIDLRKAAKLLYQNAVGTAPANTQKVRVALSISSPHRGSPIAKYVLDLKPGVSSVLSALATFYGNVVYAAGNDAYGALKQLVYKDYSSTDGVTTGMQAFNTNYPASTTYMAYLRSVLTGQDGLSMNPALYIVQAGWMNINGDGSGTTDSDNDGALGAASATSTNDADDDGLVGVNSQQMGYRLTYSEPFGSLNYFTDNTTQGSCTSLNAPTATQQTSHSSKIGQDHVDIIGIPPDTFDEMEFYAAIADYIAVKD